MIIPSFFVERHLTWLLSSKLNERQLKIYLHCNYEYEDDMEQDNSSSQDHSRVHVKLSSI